MTSSAKMDFVTGKREPWKIVKILLPSASYSGIYFGSFQATIYNKILWNFINNAL